MRCLNTRGEGKFRVWNCSYHDRFFLRKVVSYYPHNYKTMIWSFWCFVNRNSTKIVQKFGKTTFLSSRCENFSNIKKLGIKTRCGGWEKLISVPLCIWNPIVSQGWQYKRNVSITFGLVISIFRLFSKLYAYKKCIAKDIVNNFTQ